MGSDFGDLHLEIMKLYGWQEHIDGGMGDADFDQIFPTVRTKMGRNRDFLEANWRVLKEVFGGGEEAGA